MAGGSRILGEEILEEIAVLVIKSTCGLVRGGLERSIERLTPGWARDAVMRASVIVSETIVRRGVNGLYYCRLCGRGPLSRKGLYLHIVRLHLEEVKRILEEEVASQVSR